MKLRVGPRSASAPARPRDRKEIRRSEVIAVLDPQGLVLGHAEDVEAGPHAVADAPSAPARARSGRGAGCRTQGAAPADRRGQQVRVRDRCHAARRPRAAALESAPGGAVAAGRFRAVPAGRPRSHPARRRSMTPSERRQPYPHPFEESSTIYPSAPSPGSPAACSDRRPSSPTS